MIGQLCTCDIDNYGDLLYPVIFRKMAEKHGVVSDIIPLSFFQGPAPCDSRYVVQGVSETLLESSTHLSHLVIGGGDLLRVDAQTIASHYDSIFEQRESPPPLLARIKKAILRRKRWRKSVQKIIIRRYFRYSSIAPFILNSTHHTAFDSLVYCSCGVPFKFPQGKAESVREAFESASFIYVRDQQSMDKLRDVGVKRHVEVAPDLIVTLSDFFPKEEERSKGLEILSRHGVDTSRKIVCFQACPQMDKGDAELVRQLTDLKKKTGAEIVLLPIGYCHGDDFFLQRLAAKSDGALIYVGVPSIFDIISVLAASSLFIGTSMHGNITAFSFGIPHLFGPIPADKAEGFLKMVDLGKEFKLGSWSDIAAAHAMLEELPPDHFTVRADCAKKAVHHTFGKIADILKSDVARKL